MINLKLKLLKNKQRELIYKIKSKSTWKELANSLGVTASLLQSLAREVNMMPEDLFSKIDQNHKYDQYILEKYPDTWGQIKGGTNSSGTTKSIKIPEKNAELAELVGIILGDGNIQIAKKNKSTSYMLRIVGDSRKDKEYLINYVKPLCDSLFGLDAKIKPHYMFNGLYVIVNSKNVTEFLLSIGLQAGNKIKNGVTIPPWIQKDVSLLKKCIRGLIDTDGSIYELKPHWPGLWQICFTSQNPFLMQDVRNAFIKLGYSCSRISHKNSTPKIYITKKEDIRKFYKEIGFSNPKHRDKIAPWCSGLI